ncbi:hypothetical protein E4198_07965 [Streptomyces sp. RKND-216]|uniref:hypothetical protein n=1 Tax=Streptomyces sp. RKND-216 TaxID=2562581 RepID=UPI00109DE625|nr:hypothetical protein [Streptomyces sp. RKND-216]THA24684.1 hypothetical protein E4198_07965 [Streptomyces sp. RKND-216]
MRARTTAIAATACALALLPAASAVAGTGPAPDKQRKAASTAPSAAGNPLSARAQAAGVCTDAYEIGTAGYIIRDGQRIGSVKQFYSPSCGENYGYLWVWQSFRASHGDYDVSVGVYSYSRDEFVGKRTWLNTNGKEYWSNPADTTSECTAAVGSLRAAGDPLAGQAASSKRC